MNYGIQTAPKRAGFIKYSRYSDKYLTNRRENKPNQSQKQIMIPPQSSQKSSMYIVETLNNIYSHSEPRKQELNQLSSIRNLIITIQKLSNNLNRPQNTKVPANHQIVNFLENLEKILLEILPSKSPLNCESGENSQVSEFYAKLKNSLLTCKDDETNFHKRDPQVRDSFSSYVYSYSQVRKDQIRRNPQSRKSSEDNILSKYSIGVNSYSE